MICGYYAACGLADATGAKVEFHARHPEWLACVTHPMVSVVGMNHHKSPTLCDASADYQGQLSNGRVDRASWYCQNIRKALKLTENFGPGKPLSIISNTKHNTVLLSPFSAYASREWPKPHWTMLARRLSASAEIAVVGLNQHREVMSRMFADVAPVRFLVNENPGKVLLAITTSKLVIGNDSGMVHVAGLYNIPAIAIMAQMRPGVVFGNVPIVTAVPSMEWPCVGCQWQAERGFISACESLGCSALWSINPLHVAQEAEAMIEANPVVVIYPKGIDGEVSRREAEVLARFAKSVNGGSSILEIGTFEGTTTRNLALNTAATVYTVDLPPNQKPEGMNHRDAFYTGRNARIDVPNVRQIWCDSKDLELPKGVVLGMAFIDGSHTYEYVMNDFNKVLPICKPGSRIVFHDYCDGWPEVKKAINHLQAQYPKFAWEHITGTNLMSCLVN